MSCLPALTLCPERSIPHGGKQVFFSGCLHGNEQVGPTAIMEAARLMVLSAVCHADSRAKASQILFLQQTVCSLFAGRQACSRLLLSSALAMMMVLNVFLPT